MPTPPLRPPIDLHCHSTASDGTDPPGDVVRRARAAGVGVLALTDHDTVDGWPEAIEHLPAGLTLVPGCEVSAAVRLPDQTISVHVLAYLFDATEPALAQELAAIRTDRVRRARVMVERLGDLGVPVSWETVAAIADDAPVGRPHIARALVDAGVVETLEKAFGQEWIGAGGRAFEPKRVSEAAAVIGLIRQAGGVAVLAHARAERGPALDDDAIAKLAAAGLFGLEVDHPDHSPATRARLRGLAEDLGLVVTGASDDHGAATGHRLGCESTAPASYDALIAAGTGNRPVVGGHTERDGKGA